MGFDPVSSLIGGASSLVGGLIGGSDAADARKQAMALAQQSIDDLTAIGVPQAQAQQITLQKLSSAGQLTPELEQAFSQQGSEMGNISTDPADHQAQLNALSSLQDIGKNNGMRLSDLATQNQVMGNIQSREKGARDAITQDARERSRFGGGDELAAKLANQQNSAQSANQLGLGLNATAQDRALQAIQASGQLGGQMQSTEFGQKAAQAQAQDAINKFNAANSQSVQGANVAAQNAANAQNLANQQRISDTNAGTANQQTLYNSQLAQQQYQNELQKAGMEANARAGQASNITAAGNAAAQTATGIGQGINQAATAYGNNQNYQDWLKTQQPANKAKIANTTPDMSGQYKLEDDNQYTA